MKGNILSCTEIFKIPPQYAICFNQCNVPQFTRTQNVLMCGISLKKYILLIWATTRLQDPAKDEVFLRKMQSVRLTRTYSDRICNILWTYSIPVKRHSIPDKDVAFLEKDDSSSKEGSSDLLRSSFDTILYATVRKLCSCKTSISLSDAAFPFPF